MSFPFDIKVLITPQFVAHESTIWPGVNKVTDKVDELAAADDALIALLHSNREPAP